MPATSNHTIIASKDRDQSARFYLDLIEARRPLPGVLSAISSSTAT
jgi:hypothetical protein